MTAAIMMPVRPKNNEHVQHSGVRAWSRYTYEAVARVDFGKIAFSFYGWLMVTIGIYEKSVKCSELAIAKTLSHMHWEK